LILFLIFLLLLFIAGKMFIGMALESIGFILAIVVAVFVFIIRRRRSK